MTEVIDLPRRLNRGPRPPSPATVSRLPPRVRKVPDDIAAMIEAQREEAARQERSADEQQLIGACHARIRDAVTSILATAEITGDVAWAARLMESAAAEVKDRLGIV